MRASGPAFELRVRNLLRRSQPDTPNGTGDRGRRPSSVAAEQSPEAAIATGRTMREVLDSAPPLVMPTSEESHRLLTLFLSYLGVNQQFLDPRTFIDTMALLFQDHTRSETMKSVWFVQYLLVMAMAKLMDFDTQSSMTRGLDFFAEAMQLIPPMHYIAEHGVIAVEILTLVALYLQWRDRKQDAYIYVSGT